MPLESNSDFFHATLFKYQCEFRKGFNAQHCLVLVTKK